ncbi:NAD(P)/FAD-dependent oxidoreductase [Paraliobacillus sediminis]|uniref:NAD(P)/FAD-dependent oxidoreductase n=1 Tax=Paraliobacillus sediminis TaxID=1885916 RepID=UPI000E3E5AA4|nr:NAD(P)/FAD-dependent oxidoreductase [Paraliobacillus sediminis]
MGKPRIVILGAGYAGIMTAVTLQKKLRLDDAEIQLINKHAYHYQTTWLHENAAGTLADERTKIAIDQLIDPRKIEFIQDTVTHIDVDEKKINLVQSELDYDYLVVALGFEMETFQIPGLKEYSLSMGTSNQAKILREQVESQFATYTNTGANTHPLTIVVGGGGFTGVEYLGELTDQLSNLCKAHNVKQENVKIITVEAAPTVMPGFDSELGEYAMQYLEERGVEFRLGTKVKIVKRDYIVVEKAGAVEEIPTSAFIWSAGVRANKIMEKSGISNNKGSVKVNADLRAPGYHNVFVIGDCALIYSEDGETYPPTAQMTMQEAKVCASNLVKLMKGDVNLDAFYFKDRGTIASLGRKDAIGNIFNNRKTFGKEAIVLKQIIDNRVLYQIGGWPLLFKKGKFKLFH